MLRPIDMSLTIQNAAEAQRAGAQGAQSARPAVAAAMYADRLEKQARMEEQQVIKATEAEKKDVNPDGKGHGGSYQPRGRKKPDEKAKPVAPKKKPYGESLFDIKA